MKPSEECYKLIRQFEGCRLKAYQDSVGVWTIGYGTTFYPDGSKVKEGDKCTQEQAEFYLKYHVLEFAARVDSIVNIITDWVNQNQFDAIVSFAYNVGLSNLKKSTLYRKIMKDPHDKSIEAEFMRWNKAGGVVLNGLTKRRQAESDLYFS
jgi:GH24 family phage-related lysozyme (muramidase)